MKKSRMRTIRECLSLIKQIDKETAITYNFLRKLCDTPNVTVLRLGKKFLINYDELLSYLHFSEE